MIGLNWWMKPITRLNVIELKIKRRTQFDDFKEFLTRLFIRYEQHKIELPPGLDDTPTTSEATTVDDDGHYSDEIPLKGTRKSMKEPKIIFTDDKL